jgi:hypothetical protein
MSLGLAKHGLSKSGLKTKNHVKKTDDKAKVKEPVVISMT